MKKLENVPYKMIHIYNVISITVYNDISVNTKMIMNIKYFIGKGNYK